MTKSLYITGLRHAEALGDELLLGHLVVHEHDVGVAAAPMSSAWPVPSATTADVDAGGLLERRQQVREQARLLGARRRRHDDEFVLRDRGTDATDDAGEVSQARERRRAQD